MNLAALIPPAENHPGVAAGIAARCAQIAAGFGVVAAALFVPARRLHFPLGTIIGIYSSFAHVSRSQNVRKAERSVFKYGNRFLMIPLLRLGLGRFMSNPATGYFLLLQTTGHKSGQLRLTPLNYAIDNGCVICLAGFGEHAHWLANIRNDPRVRAQLPDRVITGIATEVGDQAEARRLAVQVARNCGFALVFEHPRCLLMADAQLAAQLDGRPVVQIQPVGAPLVAGQHDPGGRGWILPTLAQCLALLALIALRHYRRQAKRAAEHGRESCSRGIKSNPRSCCTSTAPMRPMA